MGAAKSAVEQGNSFRDEVYRLLEAAGYQSDPEIRIDFKKVDIRVWARDAMEGPERLLIETKDYAGTLPLGECTEFITEYGGLIEQGHADKAWLISRGPISENGKRQIEGARKRGCFCFTYENFQRRLLLLDPYLRDLIAEYQRRGISRYYVRPRVQEHGDLETYVEKWLARTDALPIAVIGGYGRGKSTFALHLAATMAERALGDARSRAPILVPLGEIADEQSVDGLIGKVLASQHRASGYHFHLFEGLNSAGRFLIIFDGFDEMKHGMTLQMFERNIVELMRLDRGRSKIIVLGRDTAFHDESEFKAIIQGRSFTMRGGDVRALGRRPFEPLVLEPFTLAEARSYVERYFPLQVGINWRGLPNAPSSEWIATRLKELKGGKFDELITRPVHAQMLCEIATQPDIELAGLSEFRLYDVFIHYLLQREVSKQSRYSGFSVEVRRKFNAALAWWLWQQGGASTTTLADLPEALCVSAVRGIDHEFDEVGLRRELTAGCLIEKVGGTIYFGHRSIQEFLVAEYLFEADLLPVVGSKRPDVVKVLGIANAEVIRFIGDQLENAEDKKQRADTWLGTLRDWKGQELPLQALEVFAKAGRIVGSDGIYSVGEPWSTWLTFLVRNGGADFVLRDPAAERLLVDVLSKASGESEKHQAAALVLWAHCLRANPSGSVAGFLALWIPRDKLGQAIGKARQQSKHSHYYVKRDENLLLWSFLRVAEVTGQGGQAMISVNLQLLEDEMALVLGTAIGRPETMGSSDGVSPQYSCSAAQVYSSLRLSESELDRIRPYFNEPRVREAIRPLVIERVRARPAALTTSGNQ